ncbi:unnamed protein product, partial [Didymodactylos carnosus]
MLCRRKKFLQFNVTSLEIFHGRTLTTFHLRGIIEGIRNDGTFRITSGQKEMDALFNHSFMIVSHPLSGLNRKSPMPISIYEKRPKHTFCIKIHVRLICLLHPSYVTQDNEFLNVSTVVPSLWQLSGRQLVNCKITEPQSLDWKTCELQITEKTRINFAYVELNEIALELSSASKVKLTDLYYFKFDITVN